MEKSIARKCLPAPLRAILLVAVGLVLNILPAQLLAHLAPEGVPLYLDCFGTVLSTMVGGLLPGVLVGFGTNILMGVAAIDNIYYCAVNVLIAVGTAFFFHRGYMKTVPKTIITIVVIGFIGGSTSFVLTWFLNGRDIGSGVGSDMAMWLVGLGLQPRLLALFLADFAVNIFDKGIVIVLSMLAYRLLPADFIRGYVELFALEENGSTTAYRSLLNQSLLRKVVFMLLGSEAVLFVVVLVVCFYQFQGTNVDSYTDIAQSATNLEATIVDANEVEAYLAEGEQALGYTKVKQQLEDVRDSFTDLEYVYVYRFEEDGVHVVFDLDSYDEEGNLEVEGYAPGDVFPFDESFKEMVPALLAGEEIDPIITDDTYGWLLTAYKPIADDTGKVQAYVCADISMEDLQLEERAFIVRLLYILLGASIVVLAVSIYHADRHLVRPINAMEKAASDFAFGSEDEQERSLRHIHGLNIDSQDEIEKLYHALSKLASDSTEQIGKIRSDAETITRMQEAIIMDFASMVEARDKCTGDHIKKTSEYVDLITREMLKEGVYPDELTPEIAHNMVRSAPLHDVGKIKISDTLLNKPGRLTDEEFEIMKTHTTEGRNILSETLVSTSDIGYLSDSIDMAYCHHEWWDGSGYPRGIAGEEIPLSARVMAVADVFDALVSRRSYKDPFPFDKAVDIIREETGTHFDPKVAGAFLSIVEDLRPE